MRALAFDRILSGRRLATALATLLVVVAALGLAAGPVAAAGTTTTTNHNASSHGTPPSSSYRKALAAFQACLAQHGVKLPSRPANGTPPSGSYPRPSGSSPFSGSNEGGFRPGGFGGFGGAGSGASNSKFAKAFAACRSKLPAGAFGGYHGGFGSGSSGSFHPSAAQEAALSNYEKCMTAHGVTIAASATIQQIESLIRSDPAAAKANTSCVSILRAAFAPPAGQHPAGGGSTGSTSA